MSLYQSLSPVIYLFPTCDIAIYVTDTTPLCQPVMSHVCHQGVILSPTCPVSHLRYKQVDTIPVDSHLLINTSLAR